MIFAITQHRAARHARRSASVLIAAALTLIAAGCQDAATSPRQVQLAAEPTPRRSIDSPETGTADFSVSEQAPLAGGQQDIGRYETPTVVAMTVHQQFAITVPMGTSGPGMLGLAGRVSGFGCTHQGEAYLVNFPDGDDYGYPFRGCQLAGTPSMTSFSDTIVVSGFVRYGYGFDAACPYPNAACGSYSGGSGVSLRRLSATLGLAGDNVKSHVLRALPRREYAIAAAPDPAVLGRHQTPVQVVDGGWTFAPDSGPLQRDVCDNGGARVCIKTFNRSGYLSLTAIVNGVLMTSAPLRVQMPTVQLSLSADSAAVGDTVLATTTVLGLDPSALSYYYVSPAPLAAEPGPPRADGLPPCLGTRPVPTRCYIVFAQPGRALVEVGAFLDDHGLATFSQRYVVVKGGARRVKLGASRRSIEPTARYWRFDVETKQYAPHPTRLPDTSRTTVTVAVTDAAGAPVPNVDVRLALHARDGSAGHEHLGDKPTGIYQTLSHEPLLAGTVNTGPSGVAKLYFVAPEASGPVQLEGASAGAAMDTMTVQVGIAGLELMPPGASYAFTGAVSGRHTDNHYGTPAALAAFRQFADSLHQWIGEPLGINDISLEQGGLFDVGEQPWVLPHGYHRRGTHADIRTKYESRRVFSKKLQERMRALWKFTLRFGEPVNEADHLHLNFYRQ
ncbi:MAG: hypothetical protein HOQ16_02180 [Gemmatimonadaceae bacterium]|nr:hypothetical protein [Gemmatimonadaceae bacterium]